jgi:hypothetical protein
MEAAKPEVLALVEGWLRESCPETVDMKGVHIFARLCELSVCTYKDAGAIRCHPGREYLSKLVGWSVTKVSRFTSKLRDYGVLKKYQPSLFNPTKQGWDKLTNVYTVPLLTPLRIKQLAVILKLKLGARMYLFPSPRKKEEKGTCVRKPGQTPYVPVSRVAEEVYARIMDMGKSVEPAVEIQTGNVAMNALLNRFAKLGGGQGEKAVSENAREDAATTSTRAV